MEPPEGVFPVPKNRLTVKSPNSRMGIQHGDNSLIDVVSLEKRMGTSQNPDFHYSGALAGQVRRCVMHHEQTVRSLTEIWIERLQKRINAPRR